LNAGDPKKGLVKSLHKGLLKWLYPDAHDASDNLGEQNQARFDPLSGRWIFPDDPVRREREG